MKQYLIGLDGGRTKTEIIFADTKGKIINYLLLGGISPREIDLQASVSYLLLGLKQLLNNECEDDYRIIGFFLGFAGGITGNTKEILKNELSKVLVGIPFINDTDLICALSSGIEDGNGSVIIAGTGSSLFYRVDNRVHRISGWGWLYDDGGSGFEIGRSALKVLMRYKDGRITEETPLIKMLNEHLDIDIRDYSSKLFDKGKDYIASFAPFVFDAYEIGDQYATSIIEYNALVIAKLISDTLRVSDNQFNRIVLAGGLFNRKSILAPLIKGYLAYNIEFIFPFFKPVVGAIIEAAKIARIPLKLSNIKVKEDSSLIIKYKE
jgi:N-acetylglucosamine kinase-like BadF-type ATPase